jgi:hypothetical protein
MNVSKGKLLIMKVSTTYDEWRNNKNWLEIIRITHVDSKAQINGK